MDCSEEFQWFTGTMLTAAALQTMLVENASRARAELHNLCHAGIASDLIHDFVPLISPSKDDRIWADAQP
jgi:hypothetical protein